MASVALFHSAIGLTHGVQAAADRLREAGHDVVTPDLYDGRVFDSEDDHAEGMAHFESRPWPSYVEQAMAAVEPLPEQTVYVGLSMGAALAQHCARQRAGALGACLVAGGGNKEGSYWPGGVPVEWHGAVDDSWTQHELVSGLLRTVARTGAPSAAHYYPGSAHLFMDSSLPEHESEQAELLWERVHRFVDRVG